MMKKTLLAFLIILVFCFSAYAQAPASESSDQWKVDVSPYVWMAGISGDVTARGIEVKSFDVSFGDVVSNLDMALAGHLEATHGKWTILGDFFYVNVSQSPQILIIRVKQTVVEMGTTYHLNPNFEVLGGARIVKGVIELTPRTEQTYSQSKTWVDPFLGGRASAKLAKAFTVSARGDIGGFSVGSNFSWNILLDGSYQFSKWGSLYFAQRWWQTDYSADKNTPDEFKMNLLNAGPYLGFTFHF